MHRAFGIAVLMSFVLSLFWGTTVLAVDPERQDLPLPQGLDELQLDEPITDLTITRPTVLDHSLLSATGTRQVVVRLRADSVGEVAGRGGGLPAQRQALGEVQTQQEGFLASIDATVLGQTEVAVNAVILEVDASQLAALAANPAVERISPVIDYERSLSETVPYIGGSEVQALGFDGTGISVAVLDSGIDYTHEAFAQILPFEDIADSMFVDEIVWLHALEITLGCSEEPDLYCPDAHVTRDQMAAFLDRALDLEETTTDFFTDDEDNFAEVSINRLAEAEITLGCGGTNYCPLVDVNREQMASFLVRAYDLPASGTDFFTDDEASIHEADINALADSGITLGCGGTNYCPTTAVNREQMAAFLFRAEGGSPSLYESAYGANTGAAENREAPDWPQANIVGGYDYVGEVWPFGRLAPDPDPIDCGAMPVDPAPDDPDAPAVCDGGHGTHVADIIGGINGVAPGVELHAVKVCSALSPSCSGVALLLAMDHALDPNGDGIADDRVDIINMSLGSNYGQAFDDDLSLAVEVASSMGVLTVAAAGNGADKPYVTGSPAAAPSALSVAQTAVPSDALDLMEVVSPPELAGFYEAVFQQWSAELTGAVELPLWFDETTEGRQFGCRLNTEGDTDPTQPNPFLPGELDGRIVLVERGICNFSEKIANIALAGGEIGVIGLVTPEDPFTGALGVCPEDACHDIPGFMIHQQISEDLQDAETAGVVIVRFDPADALPLQGTIVGSSSRGPTMLTNQIKPEVGAPGASISAEAGTDTETTPFGGTSGATPMVAGSAALLMDALSDDPRSPGEIKALLMNYAETEIYNGAPQPPINDPLAAIQRIGAGEVRVDRSLAGSDFAAWDSELATGALSFGFVDASSPEPIVLTREVTVANYGATPATFDVDASFRFANDQVNPAVSISAFPDVVVVPPGGTFEFDVTLTIDGSRLRPWTANSGFDGANPAPFNLLEYDGYVTLSSATEEDLHLAWHVLPRLSGETTAESDTFTPGEPLTLTNAGVGPTAAEGYSLLGESSELPEGPEGANLPTIDLRYAGIQTIPVSAAFGCSANPAGSFVLLFAVNTWERQTHANAPALFEWQIDIDAGLPGGDAAADYFVFNIELGAVSAPGFLNDGRNVVVAQNAATGGATAFFFTEHATNSGNTVLTICAEQIGLTRADLGTRDLTADLLAFDIYFSGGVRATDQILDLEFLPFGERYFPNFGPDFCSAPAPFEGCRAGVVPAGGTQDVVMDDFGEEGTNPSEIGVLIFTDGTLEDEDAGPFRTGAAQEFETIVLKPSEEPPAED